MAVIDVGHALPKLLCLFVIIVDGGPEPVLRKSPRLRQQFPGPLNGFFLVVVTE